MARKTILTVCGGGLVLMAMGALAIAGCATERSPAARTAMQGDMQAMAAPGARYWAENCMRCHNIRTPASLSDRQWQITLHHMRVRAGLTAEEHEAILRFLQAAN